MKLRLKAKLRLKLLRSVPMTHRINCMRIVVRMRMIQSREILMSMRIASGSTVIIKMCVINKIMLSDHRIEWMMEITLRMSMQLILTKRMMNRLTLIVLILLLNQCIKT